MWYRVAVPICPQCSASIHAGAEDRCPACGYSLLRANESFGDALVEFTRVVDVAGALTHPERMDLLKTLEQLERKISPAALCIYITDDGQVNRLRSHAHWILNHARIHHPSFGKRELSKAIEDGDLRERRPGEPRPQEKEEEEQEEGFFTRLWNGITGYLRDAFYPYAPPVKQEWMLVLVVDVQLEMACFSWGYMLDPYVNPDSINSCIVSAKLQFRERAFVPGLKKVMRSAVRLISKEAHRTNRRLRRQMRNAAHILLALLTAGALMLPADAAVQKKPQTTKQTTTKPATKSTAKKPASKPTAKPATKPATTKKPATTAKKTTPAVKPKPAVPTPAKEQPKPAEPIFEDDAVAEEADTPAEDTTPTPATPETPPAPAAEPTPAQPAPEPDKSASYGSAPRWQQEHYKLLMAGNLETGYASLFPAQTVKADEPVEKQKTDESDTTVLGRYCEAYSKSSAEVLRDPQGLLSSMERADITHVLQTLNARSNFRIYLAVFKSGQEIPGELSVDTLVNAAVPAGEYAAMVLYPLGNPSSVELGYQLMKPEDAQRLAWLTRVRETAAAAGDGVEGIMAAVRQVHENVVPLSAGFLPVTAESAAKAPLIEIEFRENTKEKKQSIKDRLKQLAENPEILPQLLVVGGILLFLSAVCSYFFFFRRLSAKLLETPPDLRLSSPYGAGVSRHVRYLEGKEAGKEKRLF